MRKQRIITVPFLAANTAELRGSIKAPHVLRLNFGFIPLELSAAAEDTPDIQPFLATVTYAGICSDGPVGGTENIDGGPYKIFIPVDLMEQRAADLKGKPVFAASSLDTHEGTTRVGFFTNAYLDRFVGTEIHALKGGGFFDSSKNADLLAKILDRARNYELGFSYDMKEAGGHIEAMDTSGGWSSEPKMENVLVLDDFKWRGATILRRETAAYQWTTLAASLAVRPSEAEKAEQERLKNRVSVVRPPAIAAPVEPAASTNRQQSTSQENSLDMDEKKLQEILNASLAPLTASISGFDTRLKALEAGRAPAAPAAPATTDGGGNKITVKDLVAGFTSAINETIKPLVESVNKLVTASAGPKPGEGQRMTLSAATIQTIERFGGDKAKDNPASEEAISAAMETVYANLRDGRIRQDAAMSAIGVLRAAKRNIQRFGGKEAN